MISPSTKMLVVRLVGVGIWGVMLIMAGVLLWIGSKRAFYGDTANSFLEHLNSVINSSPLAPLYVFGGIVAFLVIGVVAFWLSLIYIPRGRLLEWKDYFDDIPTMRR